MYTIGIGVPRNDAQAVRWFLLAANKGYAQAQYNLGLMYALGLSVSQDNTEAVKWYRLAAVQGYVKAETALKITASKLAQQNKLKALKAKEEARLKAEKVARFKAEEEARLKAEKVARLKTEEEAQLKAEEEARLKADKVAQRKAKKEAQLRAMEEKRLATIEEGKRLEGALTKQDKRFILIGLKKSGFQTIDVDGVFGAETRKTIRAYQLSLNQDASGFLNADQLASLRSIGQSAEEARSPKKELSTGEGFTLFGIKIIPLND
jgi:peptidoglycan hydrolase-like protein with peptidoglycan-binding domain